MAFNRFRFSIIARVFLLIATVFLLVFTVEKNELVLLSIFIGLVIVYQVYNLIRYLEQINRDLKRFLESIQFSDFSVNFNGSELGPTFRAVKDEFNRVSKQFLQVRSEKEERFLYFQTVVEHVATGLISFRTDGAIEFINKAALELLHVNSLRNIKNLDKSNNLLAKTLRNISAGERTLCKQTVNGKEIPLAVTATQFVLRQQKYTLVSLQDIRNEVERERITRELEIGQEVQTELLPHLNMKFEGIDFAASYQPAREVGGDYYDIIPIDEENVGIVIGDVSGKGLPAAIYMTFAKGIMQAFITSGLPAAETLSKANEIIYRTIEKRSFISMIYAVYNIKTRQITIVRAGHNPLIYVGKNQAKELLPDGMALGLSDSSVFNENLNELTFTLAQDDMLFLFTDGVNESMNASEEEFGNQRLLEIVSEYKENSAAEIIGQVEKSLSDFTGNTPAHDDRTMVAIKIK